MSGHVSDKLSAYYDGELPEDAANAVASHLATCAACAAELAQIKAISGLLSGHNGMEVSPGARTRWHRAVDGAMNRRALERIALRLSLVAACVAVVGVIWNVNGTEARGQASYAWETEAVSPTQDTSSQREAGLADWMVTQLSSGRTTHE